MSLANVLNTQTKEMEETYVPKRQNQNKILTTDYNCPLQNVNYSFSLANDNAETLTLLLPRVTSDMVSNTCHITGFLNNTGAGANSHTIRVVNSPSDPNRQVNTLDFAGNSAYTTLIMSKTNVALTGSYTLRGWWNGNQWQFVNDYNNANVTFTANNL